MLILSEFSIEFTLPGATAMVVLLHLHPSLLPRIRSGNELLAESLGVPFPPNVVIPATDYIDSFGNCCARFLAPACHLRLSGSNIVETDSFPDVQYPDAGQTPIEELPSAVLRFLLPSRYCEVDQFGAIAHGEFGSTKAGWERAVAIRDWVHVLLQIKRKALLEYGALVTIHNQLFEKKWIEKNEPAGDTLLGNPDASSLADLGSSFTVVRQMGLVPIDNHDHFSGVSRTTHASGGPVCDTH